MATEAFRAMGGERSVRRFHQEGTQLHADVLRCDNAPIDGWSSYSTLNVHLTSNLVNGLDIRVELAGVLETAIGAFDEVLADAAFHIMSDGWMAAPGVVFENLVGRNFSHTTVPHLMWAPPMPWEGLHSVTVPGGIDVKWLLAFPISEEERVLVRDQGFDVAEDLFSEHEVEYFDLLRPSVV